MSERVPSASIIRTPDQRVRVFISSTLQELATERAAAKEATTRLRLIPVMFELGARPHPPRELYRAYLEQSHIFIGIYWQKYGWVAPDMDISGLEDEYLLSASRPKLIYIKHPSPEREPRLGELLHRIQQDDTVSYKPFSSPEELRDLIENDLALLLTESFEFARLAVSRPIEDGGAAMQAEVDEEASRTRPNNLPVLRGELIGRERELITVRDLLLREEVGLVTLTGAGGSGKTRLALEVAEELLDSFQDGVFFVPLAAIRDPDRIPSAIAQTLDVRELMAGPSLLDILRDYLCGKRMLLVLDNFEQVVEGATVVGELLRSAPGLKVLATSRTPLQLSEEKEFLVPPLELPDRKLIESAERLSQYAAVELFIRRALDVRPDFRVTNENAPAIAEICYRLDGLPLAIELAAARVKLLSPQALLARLGSSLDFLKGGARDLPERQQALRSTIAWSYDLLDEEAKLFFRRLAVFAGGCTLEGADWVCGGDGLDVLEEIEDLVNNSLLKQTEAEGEPHFSMLETIREYASERLAESGEEDVIRNRHAEFYLKLAEEAEAHYTGKDRPAQIQRAGAEYGNLRAAMEWGMSHRPDISVGIAGSLSWFWFFSGAVTEGRKWQEEAIERARPLGRTPALARALYGAGGLAWVQGDYKLGRARLEESISISREFGDKPKLAIALSFLALLSVTEGRYLDAQALAQESLTVQAGIGDRWLEALTFRTLGDALMMLGQGAEARAMFERGLAGFREVGDPWGEALLMQALGMIALAEGDYSAARPLFNVVKAMRAAGDKWNLGMQLNGLIFVALQEGDFEQARALLKESLELWHDIGSKPGVTMFLRSAAAMAAMQGQAERAARLFGASSALNEAIGYRPYSLSDPIELNRIEPTARSQLGEEAWQKAWSEGREMGMDEAVEYALAEG